MRSGLSVSVVMTADKLTLDDNTTCQLVISSYGNIKFYSVNIEKLAKGSPLGLNFAFHFIHLLLLFSESFFHDASYRKSQDAIVHLSDALRVLLIWKFGGFYLDLDYVVINKMTQYENFVVSNNVGKYGVTNNAFSFPHSHHFLSNVMTKMKESYNANCWSCIGPGLFTQSLQNISEDKLISVNVIPLERYKVSIMKVIFETYFRIMGVSWQVSDRIIDSPDPISFAEWKKIFANASSVHFSGATRVNLQWQLPDDPQYSAYALLGQRFCPLSYYSVQDF